MFNPENHRTPKSLKNKRVFLTVLIGTILLAVLVTGLIGILVTNSSAHTNNPVATATNTPPLLGSSAGQNLASQHYPNPSDQSGLPDAVKVTNQGDTVLLSASVTQGYQIYECQASTTDPSGYAWKLQAPFALLKAPDGTNVIHSTDPTWLYTDDGSEVKAQVGQYTKPDGTTTAATATPDANSVPWLRLDVTVHQGGSGLFSRVDQVQRLYTAGGKAPKNGCDRDAANKHVIQPIAYTAEYVFWGQ